MLQFACEQLVEVTDLGCECDLPDNEDAVESVLDAASDFLSQLAGYPLGRCEKAYRPCRDSWCSAMFCPCCGLSGIHLPGIAPTVTEVWLNGTELVADTDYQVMITPFGRHVLVRRTATGVSEWPSCKSAWKDRTEDGTFEIVVASGEAINQLMRLAASEIACDMFAFLAGGKHLLPAGIVAATVYGVTMNTRLPFDQTRSQKIDLEGFTWVPKFLLGLPSTNGTQVLSPEMDDGWTLWQRPEPVPVSP